MKLNQTEDNTLDMEKNKIIHFRIIWSQITADCKITISCAHTFVFLLSQKKYTKSNLDQSPVHAECEYDTKFEVT